MADSRCSLQGQGGFEKGTMSVGQSNKDYKSSDKVLGQNEK